MKMQPFAILVAVIGISIGRMGRADLQAQDIAFTNLPSVQGLNYKVDAYIKVAGQLQSMGQQAATQQLLEWARSAATGELPSLDYEQRIAILCRMLFVPRQGATFERAAFLGGPSFLGGGALREDEFSVTKNYINWPTEPIEIMDGIPFAVVTGYSYKGVWDPHAAEAYVRYCMTNCVWSSLHFSLKSKAEKQQAGTKLIASPKWRRPLEAWEQKFLTEQLQ